MFNEKLINVNIETILVTLPTAGTIHPILGSLPNKGVFPAGVLMQGTITTLKGDANSPLMVVGVGTQFTGMTPGTLADKDTDPRIDPGDFIYDAAQNVARRVRLVLSDTRLILYNYFPTDLTNSVFYKIPRKYKNINAKSTGSGPAILQEQNFDVGATFENSGAPVVYDCHNSGAEITFVLNL